MSRFELELTRELKFLSVAFGLAPRSFFLGPAINFFALEPQEVAHTSVWQRMFVIGTFSPFHDSRGRRFARFVKELPVFGELRRCHPFLNWRRWLVIRACQRVSGS